MTTKDDQIAALRTALEQLAKRVYWTYADVEPDAHTDLALKRHIMGLLGIQTMDDIKALAAAPAHAERVEWTCQCGMSWMGTYDLAGSYCHRCNKHLLDSAPDARRGDESHKTGVIDALIDW